MGTTRQGMWLSTVQISSNGLKVIARVTSISLCRTAICGVVRVDVHSRQPMSGSCALPTVRAKSRPAHSDIKCPSGFPA
jgi:hypothetical protein